MSTFKRLTHGMSQNIGSSNYMKYSSTWSGHVPKMLAVATYMKHSLHGICLKNIDNSIKIYTVTPFKHSLNAQSKSDATDGCRY